MRLRAAGVCRAGGAGAAQLQAVPKLTQGWLGSCLHQIEAFRVRINGSS